MTHRPDIDGLRAVAIVSVLLFHFHIGPFAGGYVGVDVFFVISGYLITSLIQTDLQHERFAMAAFYERRVRRIFPALGALLAVNLLVAPQILSVIDLRDFAKSAVTTLLFVSNMQFANEVGYFDTPGETKPLLHTWSLGVEEQWYLLFPLLMVFVYRRAGARGIPWLVSLALTSFLAGRVWVHEYPNLTFFLMPMRAWQLLAGGVLAVAQPSPPRGRLWCEALSMAGIAAIALGVLGGSAGSGFPGINAVLACAGTTLLLYSGSGERSSVRTLLSARPAVFIGLISYSLYLWHWPIIVYYRYLWRGEPSGLDTGLMIGLTTILAAMSWRWVERPFRRKGVIEGRTSVFGHFFLASVFLIFAGSVLYLYAKRDSTWLDRAVGEDKSARQGLRLDKCVLTGPEQSIFGPMCVAFGSASAGKTMVVWGDSHAGAWLPALMKVAEGNGYSGTLISVPGCPPVIGVHRLDGVGNGNCADDQLSSAILSYIKRVRPQTTVLVARWRLYTHGLIVKGRLQPATHFLSSDDTPSETAEQSRQVLKLKLRSTLEQLKRATNVVIFRGVPELPDTGLSLYERATHGEKLAGVTRQAHDSAQAVANAMISQFEREGLVRAFDPSGVLCPQGECLYGKGETLYYLDDNHITYSANMLFIGELKHFLDASAAEQPTRAPGVRDCAGCSPHAGRTGSAHAPARRD